jgi:exodeoxyribonuclease VII small subunit
MSKKEISYEAAYEELQDIVTRIEEGDIGVDELAAKVKRAAELIKLCKAKLKSVEEDVDQVVKGMGE